MNNNNENKKKYKIEFHIHTIASKDSLLNKYFILLMCLLKHIDVIAITDHNEIKYALKNEKFFNKYGIKIIVGEEIFTNDGEIIGLYLKNKIQPNLSAIDTVKEIKKQNGLVYIPHPYDKKRIKTVLNNNALLEILDDIDFIEVHNGRNISESYSIMQEKIAEKYNLPKIIGSDAHTFYELGRNYCIVSSYKKENLKSEISKEIFCKKDCIKIAHFNTKIVRFIKMIVKGDINGIIKIFNSKFKRYGL